MKVSDRSAHALALAIALGVGGAVGWWLLGQSAAAPPSTTAAGASLSDLAGAGLLPPISAATTSLPIATTAQGQVDVFLTPDLRHRLEALLLEAGEADTPADLKRKLASLVGRHFSLTEAARATALLERYVDYRVALGAVKPPSDPTDPRALRSALSARDAVRHQHFGPEEYQALFGADEALDRYTLARLEVERNTALTPGQKQAALKDIEQDLSPTERAERTQATLHLNVAAQTAALDAQGASEQQRYKQRQAQYGDAAAQQLAQLDREERDWQDRLTQYASAQAGKTSADSLQQLRQQLFSAPEQMRLEGALALRNTSAPVNQKP